MRLKAKSAFFLVLISALSICILKAGDDVSLSLKAKTVVRTTVIPAGRFEEARLFCKKHKLDTTIAFFADMSIHSGKKRFFIIDLQHSKILNSSLCCHGMGKGSTEEVPVFSNQNGSYCTSLGKYSTGSRGYFKWGIHIHYKMHGYETTNSNSLKRQIVLHSYSPVSEEEIYPAYLPMGWSLGCPVISDSMMTKVDRLLKTRKNKVLLWIYK